MVLVVVLIMLAMSVTVPTKAAAMVLIVLVNRLLLNLPRLLDRNGAHLDIRPPMMTIHPHIHPFLRPVHVLHARRMMAPIIPQLRLRVVIHNLGKHAPWRHLGRDVGRRPRAGSRVVVVVVVIRRPAAGTLQVGGQQGAAERHAGEDYADGGLEDAEEGGGDGGAGRV